MLLDLLDQADSVKICYEDNFWQIRERCNRGYFPYWTLHKRKEFMGFSWWGGIDKIGSKKAINEFLDRWHKWPDYDE